MPGNTIGKIFQVTTFGESHGEALGVVIDGILPGLQVDEAKLMSWLERRAPGRQKGTSPRNEADAAQIVSGVFEGKTTGMPLAVLVKNENAQSQDYEWAKNEYRPGHADKALELKYGIRDHRGGGRSSGRETVSRVIAGYFASLVLPQVKVTSKILRLGQLVAPFTDKEKEDYLQKLQSEGNSAGGKIRLTLSGVEAGLGEPVFDKLKADLAKAMLSIGGCVSFSMGCEDELMTLSGKDLAKKEQVFAGIEGGISTGDEIIFEMGFKAVSTVGEKAKTGRHDPSILPRVLPVVEAMAYIVLADHSLRQRVLKK